MKKVNKRIYIIAILSVLLVMALSVLYFITLPKIELNKDVKIQMNSSFDPLSLVEKVRDGTLEEIDVDTSGLDLSKPGTYTIVYSIKDKTYEVEVEVADLKEPEFEVVSGESDAGIEIDPSTLVKNIVDDSETKVSFKKKYSFEKEGTLTCVVVVEDIYGNKSEKETTITILPKDEIAPVISGQSEVSISVGSGFDAMSGMSVSDNQSKNISLSIVSNTVNTGVEGEYEVVYEAKDRSGNTSTFTKKVSVYKIRQSFAGSNVVYLTFDDGPSYNTPKVLEILNKYNVKATFFVTGFNTGYQSYIKTAYDAGHTIALHTYSHQYSIYTSKETYYADLNQISDLVYNLTGYRSPYIRFPGGSSNMISSQYCSGIMSVLSQDVLAKGYQYYDWNVSSGDASGNYVNAATIVNNATNVSKGTVMILFHDANGKDTTVEALPSIIEYYQKLGYIFKGIDGSTSGFHHGVNN